MCPVTWHIHIPFSWLHEVATTQLSDFGEKNGIDQRHIAQTAYFQINTELESEKSINKHIKDT